MTKRNENIVRKLEEAWNKGDFKTIEKLHASDFNSHAGVPGMDANVETAKMIHGMTMGAMPDRNVEVQDIFSAGDKVVVRCRMTGTNSGGFPWFGAPANGNKIDAEWISIYRLENGKIAEHWGVVDGLTVLTQSGGWTPPPMPGM